MVMEVRTSATWTLFEKVVSESEDRGVAIGVSVTCLSTREYSECKFGALSVVTACLLQHQNRGAPNFPQPRSNPDRD